MSVASALKKGLENINERLKKAALKRGTPPGEIMLVAATKTVPPQVIAVAHELGINNFGENRVQEALPKIRSLPGSIRWHFIGHLQRNKVRAVLPVFDFIHSLDSIKLAEAIQKEAKKNNKIVDVLIQVNIGEEKSKFGFKKEEVAAAAEKLSSYDNLRVRGLMAIPPFSPDPEETRPYFRQLYHIFKNIKVPGIEMKYLSMGMSNDFEVAIEEGANIIRLGRVLFGERN
ncbi:MAG: YggS family pyridoxal phosphate-dependent enzyme [Firmicutes bacterium]|nr:YggS family pyridoxal phosphate-dependent enzyme [Bacillota bacterium]